MNEIGRIHVWKNETMQMNNEREREIKNEREKEKRPLVSV